MILKRPINMHFNHLFIFQMILMSLLATACANHSSHLVHQQKQINERNHPMMQNALMKEIYLSQPKASMWEQSDVSPFVKKYLPLGMAKQEVMATLNRLPQTFFQQENKIYFYASETAPISIPRPWIFVTLLFDDENKLMDIKAIYGYRDSDFERKK